MSESSNPRLWDVLIVGGGPAGLSAALALGRCLRDVLVCDSGRPRNAAARIFNGYLSRDGSSPGEFLRISRQQLSRYQTVELREVAAVAVERGRERHFVTLDTGERVSSRILLLATGVVDILPDIEGFQQFYGVTAHSCPFCDGWEHRGQAMAVPGNSQEAADLAIELLLWSKNVVLCTGGPLLCDERTQRQLERAGIRIIETPIQGLEGEGGQLAGLRFADGTFLPRSVIFFSPVQFQHSPLAEQLGCEVSSEDGCICCDQRGATCVPGVYAAGNASRGVQMVIAAAAEGMVAAMGINDDLLEADAEAGLV